MNVSPWVWAIFAVLLLSAIAFDLGFFRRSGRGQGELSLRAAFMRSAAWIGLAVFTGGVPLLAQLQNNSDKQMTCSNGGYDRDRARHCEIREQSLPSIGRLTIDASPNGGAKNT